jgi:ABC-type sugar transport system permease subunit
MSVYLYIVGFGKSEYGIGAAISILMLVIVAAMSVVYVRRMLRLGDVT